MGTVVDVTGIMVDVIGTGVDVIGIVIDVIDIGVDVIGGALVGHAEGGAVLHEECGLVVSHPKHLPAQLHLASGVCEGDVVARRERLRRQGGKKGVGRGHN
eukprot:638810-Prorocentrum_minimum.AAC.1